MTNPLTRFNGSLDNALNLYRGLVRARATHFLIAGPRNGDGVTPHFRCGAPTDFAPFTKVPAQVTCLDCKAVTLLKGSWLAQ